jgi:hypothetical protein
MYPILEHFRIKNMHPPKITEVIKRGNHLFLARLANPCIKYPRRYIPQS